jgi:hypothetical protein
LSEFWSFSLTVGAYIFLFMGFIATAVFCGTRKDPKYKVAGAAMGCFIVAVLFAMYVYMVRGLP